MHIGIFKLAIKAVSLHSMNIFASVLLVVLEVISTRPEANPSGKLLTMKEATITRSVYPKTSSGDQSPERHSPFIEKGGSVYYVEGADTLSVAIREGDISYGTTVSRNEFGINGGLFPSPSGRLCAYYEKDESCVHNFPILDIASATGNPLKYPFAGTSSEKIGLWIYDSATGERAKVQVSDFEDDRYLTQVTWHNDDQLLIQVLNRAQSEMHLNLYDARSGEFVKTVLSEKNDAWVEPYGGMHFISDNVFAYSTDNRDGFKNLYLVDLSSCEVKRLVNTDADIEWAGADRNYIYYTSAEISPAENHLFRVKVSFRENIGKIRIGRAQRLTKESGWHRIIMGEGEYTDIFSSFNNPGWSKVFHTDGRLKKTLLEASDPLEDYATPMVELGTVPSADGKYENHYRLIYPLGFDPQKQYPLIVYVYGGPHSQMVNDSWLGNIRMWEMLMAQRGYIVYVQDNRGTLRHGADYEKAINRECGKVEMQDQMVGVSRLMEMPWVDSSRVGVHGWSYGGFMTISLKLNYPEIFKVAVAGGPVIDWKWYEVMYGERYMDTPQTNPEGYASSSLLNKAGELDGHLLICQGAIDNVVLWQHSLSFVQKCIDAGKQVDYFPFPKAYHNMTGMERVYLYDKISDYFELHLKNARCTTIEE